MQANAFPDNTKESGYGHENVNVWEIHYSMYHIGLVIRDDVWRSPYGGEIVAL